MDTHTEEHTNTEKTKHGKKKPSQAMPNHSKSNQTNKAQEWIILMGGATAGMRRAHGNKS